MLAVMVIMGILAGMAIPKYRTIMNQANTARAIGDIKAFQTDLMAI
jgi:general secretion pathway protein G